MKGLLAQIHSLNGKAAINVLYCLIIALSHRKSLLNLYVKIIGGDDVCR